MSARVHAGAGVLALALIAIFWMSTVISELWLGEAAVVRVKTDILWAMTVLIPALMATAASGSRMARGRGGALLGRKRRRMPVIAANGVLVPCAVFLQMRASVGMLDGTFFAVQALELLAGAVNLTLMGLNMRDGLRLAGRPRPACGRAT
ncbi:hypothetical protein NYO91_16970 [Arhodomonas aquaeolei]|uniref:hypothetical protein n=1 Tax=Arhodomonas aquaeolei TaxID=2369 RepID=UPI00216A87A7|nr:hypothetical protein [Arhodomonas aquaeolei]MCS4505779.1 hypothetical protein [Arhodomonas aquaeolei]